MDCAITSLFPAADLPLADGAPEGQAGSAAELAALFAALVADLGVAEEAGGEWAARNAAARPEAEQAGVPIAEDSSEPATATALVVTPPWLDEIPLPKTSMPPSSVSAPGRGTDQPIPTRADGGERPDRAVDLPIDLAPGNEVEASADRLTALPVSMRDVATGDRRTADGPSGNRGSEAPPAAVRSIPAHAASALARTLAALESPDGNPTPLPVPPHAAAADSAAGVPARTIHASTPAVSIPAAPQAAARAEAAPVNLTAAAATEPAAEGQTGGDTGGDTGGRSYGRPADATFLLARPAASGSVLEGAAATVPQSAPVPADTARAALAPPAPTHAESGTAADVPQQIVQAIRLRHIQGGGEARLRLNPEFLGEVRIELKVSGDRVSAVLHVERDDVRQQIENSTATLRAALAGQGLNLDELSVREDGSSRREQAPDEREAPHGRKRQATPAQTFEIPD